MFCALACLSIHPSPSQYEHQPSDDDDGDDDCGDDDDDGDVDDDGNDGAVDEVAAMLDREAEATPNGTANQEQSRERPKPHHGRCGTMYVLGHDLFSGLS